MNYKHWPLIFFYNLVALHQWRDCLAPWVTLQPRGEIALALKKPMA